jgi:hypothetical protein
MPDKMIRSRTLLLVTGLLLAYPVQSSAQGRITTPKEQFGHNIGDDYFS